ncbi:hypothetical protein Pla52o_04560 [Novipirellula galeiformis]|uniref:Uncharacterized protein n=1 Tax=Novipirellula galeiformis TaxID=2528004 RepID=A0A5C6CNS0_9BACT|nr:TMEM43 family protein [Novipirellula galeiformis]TWU26603.1 hypothetical protein Pla52o_04560 [Novipirellula galeiformis]
MNGDHAPHSWLNRIGTAIGILGASLLLLSSTSLLFQSETRGVQTAAGLDEAATSAIEIDALVPKPEHDGQLVYVNGRLETSEWVSDETFAISVKGIRLERHAEMFQWQEYRTRERRWFRSEDSIGSYNTTYRYRKTWAKQPIDSSSFKHSGHDNPVAMPFPSLSVQASEVKLGGFRLSTSLIDQIEPSDPLHLDLTELPVEIARDAFIHPDGPNQSPRLYWSKGRGRSNRPAQIGDVRIYFTTAPSGEVSVMSQQQGDSFVPFRTQAGTRIDLLLMGPMKPRDMIHHALATTSRSTWWDRLVTTIAMILGMYLLIRVGPRVINPYALFTRIRRVQRWWIATLAALSLALLTIGTAWMSSQPWSALSVLAMAVAIIAGSVRGIRLHATASVPKTEHRKRNRRRRLSKRNR